MSLIAEIAADNPTHWWKLDTVSGTLADSGSGTANPLTVTGTLTAAAGADSGGGLRFDSGDYATGASSSGMPSGAQAFTFGAFFAPDAFSGDQVLFGFGGTSTRTAAFLGLTSGVPRCGFYADDMLSTQVQPAAGEMLHMVATYDGNVTAKLYVNAALVATKTLAAALNVTASAPFLGRLGVSPFGQAFTGTLAHAYLLTGSVLSPDRIGAHYFASDIARWLPEPSATRSLQAPTVRPATAAAIHFPFHHTGL